MNRRIAALTIAAVAAFGLTACSSPSNDSAPAGKTAAAAPESEATSAAPADDTSSEQTVTEACLKMAAPIQKAASAMSTMDYSAASKDPQVAVDAWTANVEMFHEIAGSVTNPDVKDAATQLAEDTAAVRDAVKKIYVEKDLSAMADLTKASGKMQSSYTALSNLCTS